MHTPPQRNSCKLHPICFAFINSYVPNLFSGCCCCAEQRTTAGARVPSSIFAVCVLPQSQINVYVFTIAESAHAVWHCLVVVAAAQDDSRMYICVYMPPLSLYAKKPRQSASPQSMCQWMPWEKVFLMPKSFSPLQKTLCLCVVCVPKTSVQSSIYDTCSHDLKLGKPHMRAIDKHKSITYKFVDLQFAVLIDSRVFRPIRRYTVDRYSRFDPNRSVLGKRLAKRNTLKTPKIIPFTVQLLGKTAVSCPMCVCVWMCMSQYQPIHYFGTTHTHTEPYRTYTGTAHKSCVCGARRTRCECNALSFRKFRLSYSPRHTEDWKCANGRWQFMSSPGGPQQNSAHHVCIVYVRVVCI